MTKTSYLSDGVRKLLFSSSSVVENENEEISIDSIRRCVVVREENEIDYLKSVAELNRFVFPRLENFFSRTTIEMFRSIYDKEIFCDWLTEKNVNLTKRIFSSISKMFFFFVSAKRIFSKYFPY